jgi:cell volume regulation protein A
MELTIIFGSIAALLLLAVIANRLSGLTHVPDLIVLLLIGIVLGPVLHWVDPGRFRGIIDILGTLALILILFQAGVEVRLREALRYLPSGLFLAILSYGLSVTLIALSGKYSLHLSWSDAILIGAALGCTSGSIVLPALQQIASPESIKITLTLESSLGEILAVLMVGSIISIGGEQSILTGLATGFSRSIGVAAALGIAIGFAWTRVWPKIANMPFGNVLNVGVVLGLYAMSRYLGGSGLLTTLVFGVTLANMPRTPHMTRQGLRMLSFHAELTFLVRSFFFVLLGIVAEFIGRRYILPILAIMAAIVLSRYLAVLSSAWMVKESTRRDKELLFWMLPRGLVTAVLALEIVGVRGASFSFLPAIAFTVILVTNVFVVWGAIRAGTILKPEHSALAVADPSAVDKAQAATANGGS